MRKFILTAFVISTIIIVGAHSHAAPVGFLVYNNDTNNSVDLYFHNFDFGTNTTLWYRTETSAWNQPTLPVSFTGITTGGSLLTHWAIRVGSSALDQEGVLSFVGPTGVDNQFNSAGVEWNSGQRITLFSPGGQDALGPVPIPSTALLVVSGLVCLIAIRRAESDQWYTIR